MLDSPADCHTRCASSPRIARRICCSNMPRGARARGLEVIIAGAGGAAHLPGMTAAKTSLPVLGVPVQSKTLSGLDSLLSIVQMPAGVPVATFAIGVAGATNAALARRLHPRQQTRTPRARRSMPSANGRPQACSRIPTRARRAAHDHRHRGRRPVRPHARIGRLSARGSTSCSWIRRRDAAGRGTCAASATALSMIAAPAHELARRSDIVTFDWENVSVRGVARGAGRRAHLPAACGARGIAGPR